jgi:Cdc6-like AAA superfamily ATPase
MEDPRNPDPGTKSLSAQLAVLHSIFRPSTPTEDGKMFKGRTLELSGVINAVQQVGQHVIVYGERGVGKTSLAYMARDAFREASSEVSLAIRVACNNGRQLRHLVEQSHREPPKRGGSGDR